MAERKETEDLEGAKRVLGALDHRLSRPPAGGYSTDEILAMMRQKTAELEKTSPRREPKVGLGWWPWAVAGLVAAAAAAAIFLTRPVPPHPMQEIAPKEQKLPATRKAAPLE
jgi:hypothetical protein